MSDGPPRRRPFQFSLGTLLFLILPVSILAGAFAGMFQPAATGPQLPRGFFVILAVVTPVGLLIGVSLVRAAAEYFSRHN
jgi:hypothetical protein